MKEKCKHTKTRTEWRGGMATIFCRDCGKIITTETEIRYKTGEIKKFCQTLKERVEQKGGEFVSKTKEELLKELAEFEELEKKVSSKKDALDYGKMELPFKVGEAYFIRTVTYFATGRVKAIVGSFLVLEDGAWIADTGRFADALKKGEFSEVEPVDTDMYVNTGSITDAFLWKHKLPREQK